MLVGQILQGKVWSKAFPMAVRKIILANPGSVTEDQISVRANARVKVDVRVGLGFQLRLTLGLG